MVLFLAPSVPEALNNPKPYSIVVAAVVFAAFSVKLIPSIVT